MNDVTEITALRRYPMARRGFVELDFALRVASVELVPEDALDQRVIPKGVRALVGDRGPTAAIGAHEMICQF